MLQRFALLARPGANAVVAVRHGGSGAGMCGAGVAAVRSACRGTVGQAMCSGLASPETQLKQAQLMAFDNEGDAIKPRPVPKSAADFEAARRAYKAEVSALRKVYKSQWEARREVEAAEARELRRRLMVRKAENLRLKAIRKRKIAARHARTRAQSNTKAQADRNYRIAARKAYMAGVSEARREWLQKLEQQAASWIPEDKIDEMITEETFAMTHPWHLEEWYARRRRYRRQARAAAKGTAYADIAEDAMDPDVATHVDGVTSPSDLVAAKEAQLAQLAPGEPPNLELLDGFEEVFPVNADNRWVKPRLFESSIIEQDDDMLDGFGSDWEEDVPVADWFAMGQRAHSTGLQLEELYFQESMVDIKARLDEFAKAHRAAYTPEVPPAQDLVAHSMRLQHGYDNVVSRALETAKEVLEPHEQEAAARAAVLAEVSDDGEGDSDLDARGLYGELDTDAASDSDDAAPAS